MNKKFYLIPYHYYFESWRLLAAALFVVAFALLIWSPAPLRNYQGVLTLAAGLGALVFVLGFALHRLAFVVVADSGIAVQLPLWRVKIPFDAIKVTRTTTLGAVKSVLATGYTSSSCTGIGSFWSRANSDTLKARLPPALSPATAMCRGSPPRLASAPCSRCPPQPWLGADRWSASKMSLEAVNRLA